MVKKRMPGFLIILFLAFGAAVVWGASALAEGTASISGTGWIDSSGDSLMQRGEERLARATVVLYRVGKTEDTQVNKTLTNADGEYSFTGLEKGDYRLTVTFPEDYQAIWPRKEGSCLLPGAAGKASSPVFTLKEGEARTDMHIGAAKAANSVQVVAFEDVNGNSGRMTTEPLLRNVRVELVADLDGEATTILTLSTNAQGSATFYDVTPGTYRVRVTFPDQYIVGPLGLKINAWYNCILPSDGSVGESAPFVLERKGSIAMGAGAVEFGALSGTLQYDSDSDGQADTVPPKGIKLRLVSETAGVNRVISPKADGTYQFDRLMAGSYTLTFLLPESMMFAEKSSGTTVTSDTAFEESITVSVRNGVTTRAGTVIAMPVTSLRVRLYQDANANGTWDQGEQGLAGALLRCTLNGQTTELTFDGNGDAWIKIMRGGKLRFTVTLPENRVFTVAGADNDFVSLAAEDTHSVSMTLKPGTSLVYTAGVTQAAGIAGVLFNDVSMDGLQGDGESALRGFTVQAVNAKGEVVAETQTGRDGTYRFSRLLPQKHTVRFLLTDTYVCSQLGRSAIAFQNGTYGETAVLTLKPGEETEGVDCGIFRSAAIRGFVTRFSAVASQAADGGMEEVTVSLATEAGEDVSAITVTKTLQDGSFYLKGAMPGTYRLKYTLPEDTAFTMPMTDDTVYLSGTFRLKAGEEIAVDTLQAIETASVSGTVYFDEDGSCGKSSSEPGLQGAVFTFVNLELNKTYTVTTPSSGKYSFPSLRPGHYRFALDLPEGWCVAWDQTALFPSVTQTHAEVEISLAPGQRLAKRNLAVAHPASVRGTVYYDLENNGSRDSEDRGAQGLVLALKHTASGAVLRAETEEDGSFVFSAVIPGAYRIALELPADHIPADGSPLQSTDGAFAEAFTLLDRSIASFSYGILKYAALSGHAYNLDGSLSGVAGRTLKLYAVGDISSPISTARTDAQGAFSFEHLKTGRYLLSMDLPGEDWFFARTLDLQSRTSVITAEQALPLNGAVLSAPFAVAMGEEADAFDVGIGSFGKLGDTAWLDVNGNGLQDEGEMGIPGVVVRLYQQDVLQAEAVTDAYGRYLFTGLYPGLYSVQVTGLAALKPTVQRSDFPLLCSVLPQSDGITVTVEGILVTSGLRNLNCDLGYVLREGMDLPADLQTVPKNNWN